MRVDRLLSILLIIANKGRVTGQELAEHFEVSLRTIYRDMEKLGEAGIPIAAEGGKGGGYYIMEGYTVDRLFLNDSQAAALSLVADNLGFLFGKNQQFNDLVMKFENARSKEGGGSDKLSINMSHFSMEEELREYLFLINKAIEESRLLIFGYTNRNMENEERTVEPMQISFSRGQWHVVGFCRSRGAYRRFKLVRMSGLRLGSSFDKKAVSREELQRIFDEEYDRKSIKVVLRFTKKMGGQLAEYFSRDSIRLSEDGSYIAEDHFPYEEGLIKFILGFGRECEVLEPPYLREAVKKYIKEMYDKYND